MLRVPKQCGCCHQLRFVGGASPYGAFKIRHFTLKPGFLVAFRNQKGLGSGSGGTDGGFGHACTRQAPLCPFTSAEHLDSQDALARAL